ncbi:MAG: alpha/beta fold hydrolase, partial [Nitrososphaerales archaeon]
MKLPSFDFSSIPIVDMHVHGPLGGNSPGGLFGLTHDWYEYFVNGLLPEDVRVYHGITLSYFDKGTGIPLVFIHGALGSKDLWKNQVDALSKQYRVIAFDVRGHGDSTKPEEGYGPKSMLGDLSAFLDHLKLDHAVLIGSSMGGVLAQMFCLSNPDRVLALV